MKKKMIIAAITAAALLVGASAVANQNTLTQLISQSGVTPLGTGACGIPDDTTDASVFCSCFLTTAVDQCNVKDPHKSDCTNKNVHSGFCYTASRIGVSNFCKNYATLMPSGVDVNECTTDISYYDKHCGC
ncbi:MAG: hypothetical protein A3J38_10565 [Gammaproteobacteria bacterium RIFCSPHIGHO2_12_FULL_45_9]|nr:MAG: hypothetical protein A3J38_10565 [Gammaproteobacteria bacterium RIFCSPHIGHO2_12_FULL_45_9]